MDSLLYLPAARNTDLLHHGALHRKARLSLLTYQMELAGSSDGLTKEIINRLAGVSSLEVVARNSVLSFKGRNEDVRVVLKGSVRKVGATPRDRAAD